MVQLVRVGGLGFAGRGSSFDPTIYEIAFDISDLDTLKEERTGASATTAASVDGPVGSIFNKGTLGTWATAPSDAARMTLRTDGSGRYWLEADGVDDRYTCSITNSAGTQTATIGVLAAGTWCGTVCGGDSTSIRSASSAVQAGDATVLYNLTPEPSVASPGAVMQSISGPGTTPAAWKNKVAQAAMVSSGFARTWNATTASVFGYRLSPAGAARYYGFISAYSALSTEDRDACADWMAGKMGITI